jgi:hypothetical protein
VNERSVIAKKELNVSFLLFCCCYWKEKKKKMMLINDVKQVDWIGWKIE